MQKPATPSGASSPPGERRSLDLDLIAIVQEFVRELHPQRWRFIDVSPSSRIERDLGIDSLGRAELILRIERAFSVRLPFDIIGQAETVEDLASALTEASPGHVAPSEGIPAARLPPVSAAGEARTLIEALEWHVARHPDRLHLTVLQDERTALATLNYGELASAARDVARGLAAREVLPGDRVALMLPTGVDFFVAFFGVLYAGAAPVPIYPPMRLSQIEEHLRRQIGILRNAGAVLLITLPEGRPLASLLRAHADDLRAVESVASLRGAPAASLPQVNDPNGVALIQYTSGSTGDPKGVALTHANLLANIRAIGRAMGASSADVFVSWLPLYHDMGLIGAWLGCLYFGAPLYVMSPLSFLVRPESWLWAMHRFRATFSAAPNFGFELCLKIAEPALKGLDLNSLRMVANGAEPVSARTIRRFIARFQPYGFRPETMAPVYGLAESSVGLAFPPIGRPPLIDRVDRDTLTRSGAAEPAKADDPTPLEIVACGQPLSGHEVRIVDDAGHELGERQEGRLEFRGPSATQGYFRNEAKTRQLIHDGWLDSGDRAYLAGGDIHITGRIKDIIIRAGRHLYPQEIEEAVGEIPGIRKGGVAAFGLADEQTSGAERVIVVAETRETDADARARLVQRARDAVTDAAGAPPDDVVLAPPRSVPKTSSGKIRRSAVRELYESHRLGAPPGAAWRQIARLTLRALGPQIGRLRRTIAAALYATWWWTVIAFAAASAWVAALVLPRLSWRWAALRRIARTALRAVAASVSVRGIERVPRGSAMMVFNHASYSDALVLAAVLPGEPAFVAKKELARQFFAGSLLRRLGVAFVDRYDVSSGIADAQTLVALARRQRKLVFFPEGTFTRRPGLSAFYLGAFRVAAEAGIAVVPGVLRGTRSMLRGGQWFPRRAAVSVEIAEPIMPSGAEFSSVLKLRDAAREAILSRCGEPDLDELAKPAPSS